MLLFVNHFEYVLSYELYTKQLYHAKYHATCDRIMLHGRGTAAARTRMRTPSSRAARSKPSSLKVRFLPVSQYLLELASGAWVLEGGVCANLP